jgi:hypothetical protein
MRRLGVWGGLGWALLLGLSGIARADDPTDAPAPAQPYSGWHGHLFFSNPKSAPPPAPVRDDKKADRKGTKPGEAPVKVAPVVDEAAQQRNREEAAYLRRLAVCDKLKQIAYQTNDEKLQRQAEQLDERVWEVYSQRIANLPVGRADLEREACLPDHQPCLAEVRPERAPYTVPMPVVSNGHPAPKEKP